LIVVKTRIENNRKYKRYLDLLPGRYKKVKFGFYAILLAVAEWYA
jgi:hypothetical protein